jgi:peptide/nickel transport system ATP-binding protein
VHAGGRDRRGRRRPDVRAVDGVSLELMPGECLALVGESGCGKTTLARVLTGLLAPTAGEVLVEGAPYAAGRRAERRARRRRVQMVFPDPEGSLSPRMRCAAIVAEPLRVNGLPEDAVPELLAAVGLAGAAERLPHELSGGERQRVALARALALAPAAVVLDEPLSALDGVARAQLVDLLEERRARDGLAYLLISHDLGPVRRLAQRIAVMHAGRIVETGPVERVLAAPRHGHTRALAAAALSAPLRAEWAAGAGGGAPAGRQSSDAPP